MIFVRLCVYAILSFLAVTPAMATTIVVQGRERSFEMYVPATAPRPLPVVMLLHGGGGTSSQMRRYTDFDRVAKADNVIAVYPQAVNGHWNDGRPEIANMDRRAARIDDVAFLTAVIDMLADRGLADPHRVFAAGLAGGGMMVLHLACTQPDRLAGAAVVAANQPADVSCEPAQAVPMLFVHGTADRFIPYAGGDILQWANIDRGRVLSADATVRQWLDIDGCSGEPVHTPIVTRPLHEGLGGVDEVTFEPCDGAPVRRIVAKGGGHTWPGARQSKAGTTLLGPADVGVNASDAIWAFFASLPPR